jgi:hypothetical protein
MVWWSWLCSIFPSCAKNWGCKTRSRPECQE